MHADFDALARAAVEADVPADVLDRYRQLQAENAAADWPGHRWADLRAASRAVSRAVVAAGWPESAADVLFTA
jgi:hypothetical protein